MFLQTTVQCEEYCKVLCTQLHTTVCSAPSCRETSAEHEQLPFLISIGFLRNFRVEDQHCLVTALLQVISHCFPKNQNTT